jgi:hypothetical protein
MTRVLIATIGDNDTISIPSALFERAASTLDAQAEQTRRQAEAVTADMMRRTNTRRARTMRRLKKTLTQLRGGIR